MDYLSWDLAILSRAIAYSNLSAASAHVGLSQPQLSRIVAKLEEQLGLTLLDRETRRKSSWTPAAYRLADIYTKTFQTFRAEIGALAGGLVPHELRIGTLEGLVDRAMAFGHEVLDKTSVMVVHLDVLDTSFLEERFAKNDLDVVFTALSGDTRKTRFAKDLGYQTIDRIEMPTKATTGGALADAKPLSVFSAFEYATQAPKGAPTEKAFVSNSLRLRQDWLESYGGVGTLPSPVRAERGRSKHEVTAVVLAHESLPVSLWHELESFL